MPVMATQRDSVVTPLYTCQRKKTWKVTRWRKQRPVNSMLAEKRCHCSPDAVGRGGGEHISWGWGRVTLHWGGGSNTSRGRGNWVKLVLRQDYRSGSKHSYSFLHAQWQQIERNVFLSLPEWVQVETNLKKKSSKNINWLVATPFTIICEWQSNNFEVILCCCQWTPANNEAPSSTTARDKQ